MASSSQTAFLGLNQWLGTDKPKREDFNRDNRNIESKVKGHVQDGDIHITPAERAAWNQGVCTAGAYTGDGSAPTRAVTLGYRPRMLFLYAVGKPLCEYSSVFDTNNVYSAVYTPEGASFGLEVSNTGFTVRQTVPVAAGGNTCALNVKGVVYRYLVFR